LVPPVGGAARRSGSRCALSCVAARFYPRFLAGGRDPDVTKTLSDTSARVTLLLVGVADTVDRLCCLLRLPRSETTQEVALKEDEPSRQRRVQ
jgi:hypothetical protein